ncbi:hypothetical protein B0T10DRAFT_494006 [Thelonectria olida]|uniref:C2H2-type domain-containing protein n=1 Tax=Thelonectria olida TaxID=1576542 RepID=A0A9P8VZQ0_9HYPO|nr:hypothetical protein B0T10DRAFT_494006 [Thelonectria olida]
MADDRIAKSVRGCLELFQKLASLKPPAHDASQQSTLTAIGEEEVRFKVWSGNIGAHKSGRRSLQYRLRDASHLQKQILALLGDLSDLLEDALAIATGDKTPWDQLEDDENLADETASLDENSHDGELPTTELEQIAMNVPDVVNCLVRLSVAIRNPAPHDRFATSVPIDASHYEPFDIQHVQTKFGEIDAFLAERLGKAISRRRQYFKYRESHHLKLSHGLDLREQKDTESTVASSIPGHAKAAYFNPLFPAIDEDALSDSGVTQTSFASSSADTERIRIPPLPKDAGSEPFECPFCYIMITATSTISWKRHVFADLRPYVCLSEECTAAEKEFTRRHEWTLHEVENHWKVYCCPCSCSEFFQSRSKCREHIYKSHPDAISTNQLDAMISLSSRPIRAEEGIPCPMCKERLRSVKQYQRHVGRHQEQLAVFALPSIQSPDNGDHVNEGISSQIDIRSEDMAISDDEVEELPVGDKNAAGESDSALHNSDHDTHGPDFPDGISLMLTNNLLEQDKTLLHDSEISLESPGPGGQSSYTYKPGVDASSDDVHSSVERLDPFHLGGDDYASGRDRSDSLTLEADNYRSFRPSVVYPSNPRHSSATIDYGDGGYAYTNAGDLVRYDLEHPQSFRSRRHESFDRGYRRPDINYNPDQRILDVNTGPDQGRESRRERRESKRGSEDNEKERSRFRDKISSGLGIAAAAIGITPTPKNKDRRSKDDSKGRGGSDEGDRRRRDLDARDGKPSTREQTRTKDYERNRFESKDKSDSKASRRETSSRKSGEAVVSGSDSNEVKKQTRRHRSFSAFDPNDAAELTHLKEQLASMKLAEAEKEKKPVVIETTKTRSSSHTKEAESTKAKSSGNLRSPPESKPTRESSSPSESMEESSRTDELRGRELTLSSSQKEKHIRVVSPPREEEEKPLSGILKAPKASFPEDTNPIREGVAPHKEDKKVKEAPPGAKWTKVSRKIVNPEALTIGKESFEVRDDFVIVLRVLNKEEIQAYASATQVLRERRREEDEEDREREYDSSRDDDDRRRHRHRRHRDDDDDYE